VVKTKPARKPQNAAAFMELVGQAREYFEKHLKGQTLATNAPPWLFDHFEEYLSKFEGILPGHDRWASTLLGCNGVCVRDGKLLDFVFDGQYFGEERDYEGALEELRPRLSDLLRSSNSATDQAGLFIEMMDVFHCYLKYSRLQERPFTMDDDLVRMLAAAKRDSKLACIAVDYAGLFGDKSIYDEYAEVCGFPDVVTNAVEGAWRGGQTQFAIDVLEKCKAKPLVYNCPEHGAQPVVATLENIVAEVSYRTRAWIVDIYVAQGRFDEAEPSAPPLSSSLDDGGHGESMLRGRFELYCGLPHALYALYREEQPVPFADLLPPYFFMQLLAEASPMQYAEQLAAWRQLCWVHNDTAPRDLLARGCALMEMGEYHEADGVLRVSMELLRLRFSDCVREHHPVYISAVASRAELLVRSGRHLDALELLKEEHPVDSSRSKGWWKWAKSFFAEPAFEPAATVVPALPFAELQTSQARAFLATGDRNKALEVAMAAHRAFRRAYHPSRPGESERPGCLAWARSLAVIAACLQPSRPLAAALWRKASDVMLQQMYGECVDEAHAGCLTAAKRWSL